MKFCKKCMVETLRDAGGRCKPCTAARGRAYYNANPEKYRTKSTVWHQANSARKKALSAVGYAANRDAVLSRTTAWAVANRDAVRAIGRDWGRAHPHKSSEKRAAKAKRLPAWADRAEIRRIYSARPAGYHIDHVIPLCGKRVSGLHIPLNLVAIPALENLRKGANY